MTVIQLTTAIDNSAVAAEKTTGPELPELLAIARQEAQAAGLTYAGSVFPEDAWKLFIGGQAHLIDVRTAEERKFVGHVPNTLHIAWQTGPALIKNPRFLRELENKLPKDAVILFFAAVASARQRQPLRRPAPVLPGCLMCVKALKAIWMNASSAVLLAVGVSVDCLGSRIK